MAALIGPYATEAEAMFACASSASCHCTGVACWQFTLSGIGGGAPCCGCAPGSSGPGGNCTDWNGTFKMVYVGSGDFLCWWIYTVWECNSDGAVSINLWFMDGQWQLFIDDSGGAGVNGLYTLPGDLNCSGSNVFNKVDTPGDCTGWPSTITISPTTC